MFAAVATYAVRPAGTLLVLILTISLFWCGDAGCTDGAGDEPCTATMCSSHSGQDNGVPHQHGDDSSSCMCVCHMPSMLGFTFDSSGTLPAQRSRFEFIESAASSPSRSIYHPPKA
ncbi:MAG: hypothetical protein IPP94_06240 [Ignavibacteria bacterium]|nr:hypothetical protein [Ignavibacteria bacterium]